jgi:hypothetical protein
VQVPHLGQAGVFDIENHDLRPVPGDSLAEFVSGARQVNGIEVRRKPAGQRLSQPGIAFKNYYTRAHRSS